MYKQVSPKLEMAVYAARVIETLVRNMAYGVRKVLDQPEADNVHDLRVTSLRLRHALRLWAKFFGARRSRKTRRRLGELQDLLAAVRSCDIGLQTLSVKPVATALNGAVRRRVVAALNQERRRSLRPLRARLRKMQRSDTLQRWRTRLLPAP